jgi:hypothetical protein
MYSICMPLFNRLKNNKRKPVSKGKVLARVGIGAAVVATALTFIGRSMEKSQLRQLARVAERERTSASASAAPKKFVYENKYPPVSEKQVVKEIRQIKGLLGLNLANKTDQKVQSMILKIAKDSGVSPRVALRTLARSTGKMALLKADLEEYKKLMRTLESEGNSIGAKSVNEEVQRKGKILEILESFNKFDTISREMFLIRIEGH